jgi:hypothetical protein
MHHLDTSANYDKRYSLVTEYSFCSTGLAYDVASFLVGARKDEN